MSSRHFDELAERLLRAGVRARHVKRYLGELRDHFDDTVRVEQARGATLATAEGAAWARLGDDETLIASALARPELRALSARYPVIAFGIAPVLALPVCLGLLLLKFMVLAPLVRAVNAGAVYPMVATWCVLANYIVPLIVGLVVAITAARQRMADGWAVLGIGVVAIASSVFLFTATPPMNGMPGELTAALSSFTLLAERIGATAIALALFYWTLKRLQRSSFAHP